MKGCVLEQLQELRHRLHRVTDFKLRVGVTGEKVIPEPHRFLLERKAEAKDILRYFHDLDEIGCLLSGLRQKQAIRLLRAKPRLQEQTHDERILEKPARGSSPGPEVVAAGRRLNEFVQSTLREFIEAGETTLPGTFAAQLRNTEQLAFAALRSPRAKGRGKAIQIEAAEGQPQAICERCDGIFNNNDKCAGRNMITRFCKRHAH